MIIPTSVQYGIILIQELRNNSPEIVTVAEVCRRHQLSEDYMFQISRRMKLAGLIEVKRGPGGGCIVKEKISVLKLMITLTSKENPDPLSSGSGFINDMAEKALSGIFV